MSEINVDIVDGLPDAPADGVIYGRRNYNWVDMVAAANLQVRRGTAAQVAAIIPLEGEPVWATDTKLLRMGDGATAGGIPISGMNVLRIETSEITIPSEATWTLDSALQVALATSSSVWYVDMLAAYRLTAPVTATPEARLPASNRVLTGHGVSQNHNGTLLPFDPAFGTNSIAFTSSSTPDAVWIARWSGLIRLTAATFSLGFEHRGSDAIVREKGYIAYQRIS